VRSADRDFRHHDRHRIANHFGDSRISWGFSEVNQPWRDDDHLVGHDLDGSGSDYHNDTVKTAPVLIGTEEWYVFPSVILLPVGESAWLDLELTPTP
jgi:hypothetical protein